MIRNSRKKAGLAALVALLILTAARGYAAAQVPGGGPRGGGFGQRMAQELGLTEAQKSQIQSYLQDARSQLQVLRDTALTQEQRRAQARQIRETAQAKVRAVLTPDQQAKADQLRQQAQQRMEARREEMTGRMLGRLTTELGLSDSQNATIKSYLDQQKAQAGVIRDNSALNREQKQQQLQALRQQTQSSIRGVLTTDQQAKADQLRQQAQQRRQNRMGRQGFGPRRRGPVGPRGLFGPRGISL